MNKKFLMLTCASILLLGSPAFAAEPAPADAIHHEMKMEKPEPQMERHGDKLADDLELTAEQRQKAEAIRKADFEKMKPLMDQMQKIRKDMDDMRKENMKAFEAILTPLQKAKLDGIMLERKRHQDNGDFNGKPKHERKGFDHRRSPNREMMPPRD